MLEQAIGFVDLQLRPFNGLVRAEEVFDVVDGVLQLLVAIQLMLDSVLQLVQVQFKLRNDISLSESIGTATHDVVDVLKYLIIGIASLLDCGGHRRAPLRLLSSVRSWRSVCWFFFELCLSVGLLFDSALELLDVRVNSFDVGASLSVQNLLLLRKFFDLSIQLVFLSGSRLLFGGGYHTPALR